MSRTSAGPKRRRFGFTLLELVIGMGISAILAAALAGVCVYCWTGWNQVSARADALLIAQQALEEMSQHVIEARSVQTETISGNPCARVEFPMQQDGEGFYYPEWNGGALTYEYGYRQYFYTSNLGGSESNTGDNLWRGNYSGGLIVPDASWSRYYDTGRCRFTDVTRLEFQGAAVDRVIKITIQVTKTKGNAQAVVELSRWICVRHHN